jgi:hypothetical protein
MWRPTELGEVIAEREATVEVAGESRAVILRFGKPVYPPTPEEGDPWWCPLQIVGLGSQEVRPIAGSDSLQALLLALRFVREHLPTEAARVGGRVYWLSEDMDAIFDDRPAIETYRIMASEALGALEAAEPFLQRDSVPPDVINLVTTVLAKYGEAAKTRSVKHERGVFERAKTLYFRLRDKFEDSNG